MWVATLPDVGETREGERQEAKREEREKGSGHSAEVTRLLFSKSQQKACELSGQPSCACGDPFVRSRLIAGQSRAIVGNVDHRRTLQRERFERASAASKME